MKPRYAEDTRPRMCEQKQSYGEGRAKQHARRLRLRAYQCPHCWRWHLTKVNADGAR